MGIRNRLRKQFMIRQREETMGSESSDLKASEIKPLSASEIKQMDKALTPIIWSVKNTKGQEHKEMTKKKILEHWRGLLSSDLRQLDKQGQIKKAEAFATDFFNSQRFTELCELLDITAEDLRALADSVLEKVRTEQLTRKG